MLVDSSDAGVEEGKSVVVVVVVVAAAVAVLFSVTCADLVGYSSVVYR